jgi:hypothetical protein
MTQSTRVVFYIAHREFSQIDSNSTTNKLALHAEWGISAQIEEIGPAGRVRGGIEGPVGGICSGPPHTDTHTRALCLHLEEGGNCTATRFELDRDRRKAGGAGRLDNLLVLLDCRISHG